ncbi:MAG: hypothetical protein ABR577_10125 [Pyrinomonadaceae bacterium]
MTHTTEAHTVEPQSFLRSLDEQFAQIHERSCAMLRVIPPDVLYAPPREDVGKSERAFPVQSCGEYILRAAAAVEQTFGGITANLWDDPFEWTLPETLSTPERVTEYLSEVESTRRRAFDSFHADAELQKELVVPSGATKTLCALLLETLTRAAHYQGCAAAVFQLFSTARLPIV